MELGYYLLLPVLAVLAYLWFKWRAAHARLKTEFTRGFNAGMERMLEELDARVATATSQKMAEWKLVEEPRARKDAIRRSISTVTGKVAEQLVPFSADWLFNPRDARFLGSPIDFVVFDGMTKGQVKSIVLVEVKTGKTGTLTLRQRQVQDCVELGEVEFEVLHIKPKKESKE